MGSPRRAQGAPRRPRRSPSGPQGVPEESPTGPQGSPRGPKGSPRGLSGVPKGSLRGPQGVPKGFPRATGRLRSRWNDGVAPKSAALRRRVRPVKISYTCNVYVQGGQNEVVRGSSGVRQGVARGSPPLRHPKNLPPTPKKSSPGAHF